MAALPTRLIGDLGGTLASPATPTPTTGDTAEIDCTLVVRNGSGGSINVTITTPGTVGNNLAVADQVIAVAAGATRYIPLPRGLYLDPADERAHFVCSATASVEVHVIKGL